MIVAIDGCKGVGKTTLLESLQTELSACVIAEDKKHPFRRETLRRVTAYGEGINRQQELMLLPRFLRGKALLNNAIQNATSEGSIVLLDRWYVTDFAFRRFLRLDEVLEASALHRVFQPDFYFVLTCEPKTAWSRLLERARGVDSLTVNDLPEWERVNARFLHAASEMGADVIHTDGSLELCVQALRARLKAAASRFFSRPFP